jgi:hypothetical protein
MIVYIAGGREPASVNNDVSSLAAADDEDGDVDLLACIDDRLESDAADDWL